MHKKIKTPKCIRIALNFVQNFCKIHCSITAGLMSTKLLDQFRNGGSGGGGGGVWLLNSIYYHALGVPIYPILFLSLPLDTVYL